MSTPAFIERLRAGELTLMLGVRLADPRPIRLAHQSGHHAVLIDLEHSTMSLAEAGQLCGVARDVGVTPFVRIREGDYGSVTPLRDCGADGYFVPGIKTAEHAARAVAACRPSLVHILLETPEGVANAATIAAIPGVDLLVLGANDFTAELGIPGCYDDPRLAEAVQTLNRVGLAHDTPVMLGGIADLSVLSKFQVCPLVLTGMDTALLTAAVHARAEQVKTWWKEKNGQ